MIIPIINTVILPNVQYHLVINTLSKPEADRLLNEDISKLVLLPLNKDRAREEMLEEDFYMLGVEGKVLSVKDTEEGLYLQIKTTYKVKINNITVTSDYIEGDFEQIEEKTDVDHAGEEEITNFIKDKIKEVASYFKDGIFTIKYIEKLNTLNELISVMSQYMSMTLQEKQAYLETDSYKERGIMIGDAIMRHKGTIELRVDMQQHYNESEGKAYREAAIKKQMDALTKELESMDPDNKSDEDRFKEKIAKSGMPKEALTEANRALKKFVQEGSNGHEYGSLYDYLDFVTTLSWKTPRNKKIDMKKAREALDSEHYGLKKVKERILEHIAVMALNKSQTGSIILLVGAPGTGKTSMGKSIAQALGRKYVRISLGGVRDEAEIRGHRRTYVGAMPGRIMDGIKRCGVNNPVMVLDEVDKLTSGYNGDPASALLEVLDPEQNNTFTDHYMNVPYDLSKAFFVCTANSTDTIPKPLLDRMEVIRLSGYTPVEKFHIAKDHLIDRSLKENGIKKSLFEVTDDSIKDIIDNYTMEAGVRGLKKQIDKLCRNAAVKLVENGKEKISVTQKELKSMLGKKLSSHDKKLAKKVPGVVTGLAWTQAGGEILFIESIAMTGTGQVHITGQLGDVMKESANIAASLVKSLFMTEQTDIKNKDIHIHVPEGAIPKDGPSAGITMFTALTSLVTGIAVNTDIAMTGEISLRGQVLAIGGLPEKLMAAERAGIKKVLIPAENEEDLSEVPEETKEKLNIVLVNTIEDVLKNTLNIEVPQQKEPVLVGNMRNSNSYIVPSATV